MKQSSSPSKVETFGHLDTGIDPVDYHVCTLIVEKDLCIGCGICTAICPTDNLPMELNESGAYIPVDQGRCLPKCTLCLQACPFFDNAEDEDTLSKKLFGELEGVKSTKETGSFLSCYAGYVSLPDYRARGSSGGIASWFLAKLLEDGIVDRIACVTSNSDPERIYKFALFDTPDDVKKSGKSAYYPVEMSGVIETILKERARYAIVGLPCFIKGIRLAMLKSRKLRERTILLAGIVCGQTKTTGFAEYLVRHLGFSVGEIESLSFWDKDPTRPANDLIFTASNGNGKRSYAWSEGYKETWNSGEFKVRACDFCDDVYAELADITFFDAWLSKYTSDALGNSIVLTRSLLAEGVMRKGIEEGALDVHNLSIEDAITSQQGVIRQKRPMLQNRLWMADRLGQPRPKKRVAPVRPGWLEHLFLASAERLRVLSCEAMNMQQKLSSKGLDEYRRITRRARQVYNALKTIRFWFARFKRIPSKIRRIISSRFKA